ncbi:MAG: hypothetical protein ABI615_00580 [Chthoniobacterales bacterium]
MKSLFAIFLLFAMALNAALASDKAIFILSRVAESPTSETREMPLRYGSSVENILVDQNPLLNDTHIASALLIEGPPVRIQIKLTPEGREKLEGITKYSIGKRLAIQMNGQLVSAPTIRSEVSGGVLEIAGNLDYDAAEKIVTALNKNHP